MQNHKPVQSQLTNISTIGGPSTITVAKTHWANGRPFLMCVLNRSSMKSLEPRGRRFQIGMRSRLENAT